MLYVIEVTKMTFFWRWHKKQRDQKSAVYLKHLSVCKRWRKKDYLSALPVLKALVLFIWRKKKKGGEGDEKELKFSQFYYTWGKKHWYAAIIYQCYVPVSQDSPFIRCFSPSFLLQQPILFSAIPIFSAIQSLEGSQSRKIFLTLRKVSSKDSTLGLSPLSHGVSYRVNQLHWLSSLM